MTLPDTSCTSAVGVGESDIPHAYIAIGGLSFSPTYACPDRYPGENGFGINGALLFARAGPDANGDGDGVVACYGSTDPTAGPATGHHGSHPTIYVRDDQFGGAIGFSVVRDYNRSADNGQLPSTNQGGNFDCGDRLVEPCPAGYDHTLPATDPNAIPGGCNQLDDSQDVFPQDGICTGLSSLGNLFNPPTDPNDLLTLLLNFLLNLIGLAPAPVGGTAECSIPSANTWTAPGTLGEYAGADGTVTVFVWTNLRVDAGHAGGATTGRVWTDHPPTGWGNCTMDPGLDGRLYQCVWADWEGFWFYRSNCPHPHQPSKSPKIENPCNDFVISKS